MDSKICTKCKIDKNVEEFSLSTQSKDGRSSSCKECFNIWQRGQLILPYNKMQDIHLYDEKLHLVGFYDNVIEAVMYNPKYTAVDIYKRCLSEKMIGRRMFSFKGYLPYSLQRELEPFLKTLS